jgi:ketosteroid isomerase-like protein
MRRDEDRTGDESRAGIVRKSHQAFNERDRDALLSCLAEDVVWHVGGEHPMAGSYEGTDSLWEGFMGPMWASPARVEDHEVRVHGDYVLALGEAVHDFGAGEQRFETVEILRLEEGRIIERWEFTSGQDELDRFFIRGCAAAVEQAPD